MSQLRRDYTKFQEKGTSVVIVGPENADTFKRFWRKNQLPFIGLPDPKYHVLKLYGQEIKIFKFGRMPAQVIIDRRGNARYIHYGKSMSDIPQNSELLRLIDKINQDVPN